MGNANHLMIVAQGSHFRSDRVRDLAADVGVDLVEHEQWNRVVGRQGGFDREHQARDFAARGDGAERLQRFARVRREK